MTDTHKNSDSLASLLLTSSLTSLSSVGIPLTEAMKSAEGNESTDSLLDKALERLTSFKNDESRLHPHPSNLPVPKGSTGVDPYKLVKAMLDYAPTDSGQRYVAAAIVACKDTPTLVDLANTWLRYLLLPFRGNRTFASFPPSDLATPTLDEQTAYSLDSLHKTRDPLMTKLVRLREGYQCPITELYSPKIIWPGMEDLAAGPLENAHILKRAVGTFDPQKDKGSLATWDILRNYVGWDAQRTQEVVEKLDTPLNGILLYQPFHRAWDDMIWTLKPLVDASGKEIPDTYEVDVVRRRVFPGNFFLKPSGTPINYQIVFRDRGTETAVQQLVLSDDRTALSKHRPMPDPELIKFHRALCWIHHLSGAAEVIDAIFRDAEDAGVQVPSGKIRTTDELETLLSTLSMVASGAT